MQQLTPVGENIVNDISRRYNLSFDSTVSMLVSVNRGGGSMAQFSCPELGSGQWMRGGMTMVGDMFNHGLKNTVNNLCAELSDALANNQMFPPTKNSGSGGGNNWWPGDFGSPSSSGAQNNIRYAFFPQAQRLCVERDGQVTVFNTLNHNISGVSQQQGGNTSLTFSSQFGTISTLSLPMISGPGLVPESSNKSDSPNTPTSPKIPNNNFAVSPAPAQSQQQSSGTGNQGSSHQASSNIGSGNQGSGNQGSSNQRSNTQASSEVMDLLEKLGQLRDSGVLTPEEFSAKKSELLGRL